MKVWIVTDEWWSELYGVFSAKEKAEEYIKRTKNTRLEAFELPLDEGIISG